VNQQPQFETFASGLDHPECIAFDGEGNVWAGGEAGQIYRIDPSGAVTTIATLGGFNAGLAFSPVNRSLYVCNAKLGIFRVESNGSHALFAAHAGEHKIVCPNYPLFDRRGRLYVTDSGKWKQGNGYLLRFDQDGGGTIVAGPFGYANGLALSADERHLFMVESDTDRVFRFALNANGELSPAEIYADRIGRLPDGLALDVEGNLYVACYASDEIWRISPSGEKQVLAWDYHAIVLSRPTNLAWGMGSSGGDNRDVLYVSNLGRDTVTRARLPGVRGQALAHQH
jgi:gluconolactonase